MSERVLCVITARGGSKRIPRKNIKDFCGEPIISYSIRAALESRLFDTVMVSTDDGEIAQLSQSLGAEVPFMRSARASDDFADTADVIEEVLGEYQSRGYCPEAFCCIYPTAPFVTAKKLRDSSVLLNEADAVVSVTAFSFPPQRAFYVRNGRTVIADMDSFQKRSQDLEAMYHDCGQFYWGKTKTFLRSRSLIPKNTAAFIIPESEAQDIDNPSDWILAEMKYERMVEGDGSQLLHRG